MRADDDDFAVLVVAREFQLVDGTGSTVASFSASGPPFGGPALSFIHEPLGPTQSGIYWSRNPGLLNNQFTYYTGAINESALGFLYDPVTPANSRATLSSGVAGIVIGKDASVVLQPANPGGNVKIGSLPGRDAYLTTYGISAAATAGLQAVNVASANVTGMTLSIPNCLVGDVIRADASTACTRSATATAGNYMLTGFVPTAKCAALTGVVPAAPIVRMGLLNDIQCVFMTQDFICNAAGTVIIDVQCSAFAAGDYSVQRDWSAIAGHRISTQ